jgi:hypothetical protein
MWRNGFDFAKQEQGTLWIFIVEISRSVTQPDSYFWQAIGQLEMQLAYYLACKKRM